MKLGVDIDGVQYNFVRCSYEWLISQGYHLQGAGVARRWNYFEDWGITLAVFKAECDKAVDAGWMFNSQPIEPEWVNVLTELRSEGDTVHLMTDRSFGTRSMTNTEQWLHGNKVPYDTLTFTADKAVMDVDVLLDDKPQNIIDVLAAGTANWVAVYNQSWNAPDCPVDWERDRNWSTIDKDRRVKRVSTPHEFAAWVRTLRRQTVTAKGRRGVTLNPPTPLQTIEDILTQQERKKLHADLVEMAKLRRKAETESANIPMS